MKRYFGKIDKKLLLLAVFASFVFVWIFRNSYQTKESRASVQAPSYVPGGRILVLGESPECEVVSPVGWVEGQETPKYSGVVDVEVQASDNNTVTKVEIYARHRDYYGGPENSFTLLSESVTPPYTASFDTTTLPLAYTVGVDAFAHDADGNIRWCPLFFGVEDITPPQISITSPVNGSVHKKGTKIPVELAYSDAYMAKLELYADGRVVCTIGNPDPVNFTPMTCYHYIPKKPGDHTLQAKAYDSFGNYSTSDEVVITGAASIDSSDESPTDTPKKGKKPPKK